MRSFLSLSRQGLIKWILLSTLLVSFFPHDYTSSLTWYPSCSPWWMVSQSQPAGRPSDYNPARLSERRHNNRARRGGECPSSASRGTAAHTHSIASAGDRSPPPGSYLEKDTERRLKTKDTILYVWRCCAQQIFSPFVAALLICPWARHGPWKHSLGVWMHVWTFSCPVCEECCEEFRGVLNSPIKNLNCVLMFGLGDIWRKMTSPFLLVSFLFHSKCFFLIRSISLCAISTNNKRQHLQKPSTEFLVVKIQNYI